VSLEAPSATSNDKNAEPQGKAFTLALVGAPNAGKTTLFNGLTGGRAKIANYPGVTVEMREGRFTTPEGRKIIVQDLPGIHGLSGRSTDARIALNAIRGEIGKTPDLLLVLIDAPNLHSHLQFAFQIRSLGLPMIVVLNMIDLAKRDGVEIDLAALEKSLGVPVVATSAPRKAGRAALVAAIDAALPDLAQVTPDKDTEHSLRDFQIQARQLSARAVTAEPGMHRLTRTLDAILLHPFFGFVTFLAILFLVFQAVYAWAEWPMGVMDGAITALSGGLRGILPDNWIESLLVDGIIAGVGSVVIFLPQILVLFFFILIMEMSGYMARAAFLMDELMLRVGLNGRAFIPLLSSFACAIPGIMAARVMESERDRLTTIMIAPLMTCSARIPVYILIIGAFIPASNVGPFGLQGLVMFALYVAGIVSAVIVAFVFRRILGRGGEQPLMMELPSYKMPQLRDLLVGLWSRAKIFLRRAGTVIFTVSIVLWFLVSYPGNDLRSSFAGMIGRVIEPIFKPLGFNLEIVIALVPGMAAREVAVGALGTVYAIDGATETSEGLYAALQAGWSLPTALAFLAWYVYAPQCISTLAVVRRETNSWARMWGMTAYLFALAWFAAFITYRVALALLG